MENYSRWLYGYLKHHGPSLIPTIQEAAKKDGYKRKDLKAAKKEITVKTWRKPYTDDWYWYLPEDEKNLPV